MTGLVTTHADFAGASWHDNYIYGVSIGVGDIAAGDWRAELVLDIDHIIEWVRGEAGGVQFRVAPATLAYHHATDLKLDVDWGDSGHQTAVNEASIHQITRTQIADQKICLDRPYYRWRIELNWPAGGDISFGASGYTQTLRSEPILQDAQKLVGPKRAPLKLPLGP
ncbi:MAG: hypothetical protein ACR2OM_06415 [Aestuariivirgaceae bacterium]